MGNLIRPLGNAVPGLDYVNQRSLTGHFLLGVRQEAYLRRSCAMISFWISMVPSRNTWARASR